MPKILKGGQENKKSVIYEVLCILQQTIGEEAFCEWAIRGLQCVYETQILQQRLYEQGVFKDRTKLWTNISFSTSNSTEDKSTHLTERKLRIMWERWQIRCSSYRRQLSEQQYRKFISFMSQLPYETTLQKRLVQDLWKTSQRVGVLRQALSEIQKIWEPIDNQKTQQGDKYRIRKITPTEAWRLMGFEDKDVDAVKDIGMSDSAMYKQAGNSIITNCVELIAEHLYKAQYDNVYICYDMLFIQNEK